MRNRILLLVALLSAAVPCQASAILDGSLWGLVAARLKARPSVLYGIALQESGMRWKDGTFRPWPWTLGLNKAATVIGPDGRLGTFPPGPLRYRSYPEACAALDSLARQGFADVDVGLMQVSLRWHGRRVAKPQDLLDPRTNLLVAGGILAEAGRQSASLGQAVGRYHSRQPGQGRQYAKRVFNYAQLVDAGR